VNVLFVEDYALAAALLCDTLRRRAPHIRLDVVTSIGQALARLREMQQDPQAAPTQTGAATQYDIVLTDLNLPDGSGLDILQHMRSGACPLPVVILAGSTEEGVVRATLDAGASDCVIKHETYLADLPGVLAAALDRFASSSVSA